MNIRFTICDLRVRGGIGASGVWRGLGGLVVRRGETKTSNTEHRMRDGKESRTRTRTRTTTRTKLKITNAQAIMTNQFSNCQIPDGEHFGAFRSLWGGGVLAGRGARNYKKRLISRIIPPFPAYSRVLKGKFFPVFLDSVAICRLWSELWYVCRLMLDGVACNRWGKAPSRRTLPAQSMTMRSILKYGCDFAWCDFAPQRVACVGIKRQRVAKVA